MNNKFYQKYKELFSEGGNVPPLKNTQNFKLQHPYYSPSVEKSNKSKLNFADRYQSQILNQQIFTQSNTPDESPSNFQFKNKILPKLRQYDVKIQEKTKGKNQNIFSNANRQMFQKNRNDQVLYRFPQKVSNPEEDYQVYQKKYKFKEDQNSSKKKVRFTEPQIIFPKNEKFIDTSQYKDRFPPLSLSAASQISKDIYNYQFQRKKAERKFGKKVFRMQTQPNQQKKYQRQKPYKKLQILPKVSIQYPKSQEKKIKTQPIQTPHKYQKTQDPKQHYYNNKDFSFQTNNINQDMKLKQNLYKVKLEGEIVQQLQKLQQKYKERKKSAKFKPQLMTKQQKSKNQQHKHFINQKQHQTEHSLSLLFSQYENQYEFIGKRLQDIKNFQRFYPHLMINNYRQALMRRVQAKKKLEERQKKLKKMVDTQTISSYIRSKSPFQE